MPRATLNRRAALQLLAAPCFANNPKPAFPGEQWEMREPAALGIDARPLDRLAQQLGGRGCVVKGGYVLKTWGDQAERGDLLSSAKPILSTLLFFAVAEGKVKNVQALIGDFGWNLLPKDSGMQFFHLANMISGYARPEPPGVAWAYNDYAIMLYQKTLFDKVFQEDPKTAAMHPKRLGALHLQEGLEFRPSNRRISSSVRDFARIAWFWLQQGNWGGRQILPRHFFTKYQKPQVAKDLPQTAQAKTNDYLGIGTYGGESDHFTNYGPGIYGFNWWFNGTGRLHPNSLTWPDAPRDAFMSIGAGGNCSVMIPSLEIVLASARGNWGKVEAGNPAWEANQYIKLLVQSVSAR